MNKWIIDIFEENLKEILNSTKKVEGRTPDPSNPNKRYDLIKKGDILSFRAFDKNQIPIKSKKQISFEVEYNKKYDTLKDYLESEGIKRISSKINSIEEGISRYNSLPGYKERISKFGIHAIGIGKRVK